MRPRPKSDAMAGESQTSNAVLLVRPGAFGFHAEAAASNAFAQASSDPDVQARALKEFDGLAERLAGAGVEVLVLDDDPEPPKPDAVFPNNWVSSHADGTLVLYPMATASRQIERNVDGVKALLDSSGFDVRRLVDLSFHERHGRFLEGTGSLVLDRPNRRAYASRSPRTDPAAIADFDDRLDYSTFIFEARDRRGQPIYHTNVLMSLGTGFCVLCGETVDDPHRDVLIGELEASGRTVIDVDYEQLRSFACNLLELQGSSGPLIALSSAALASFKPDQLRQLERFGALVDAPISTIEAVGGGSVRCMIADIHLPRHQPGEN